MQEPKNNKEWVKGSANVRKDGQNFDTPNTDHHAYDVKQNRARTETGGRSRNQKIY